MLYPLSTKTRELIDLCGVWNFNFEGEDVQSIAVPGSFNDQLAGYKNKHYVGNMTYERDFSITSEMKQKRVFIRFGSVAHIANVFVNETNVGSHKGGFTPFEFEITDIVNSGENKLRVEVSNILDKTSLPVGNCYEENGKLIVDENFDFFNYAGIHRPVKLWVKPKNFIQDIVITYKVEGNKARVKFDVKIDGEYKRIKVILFDKDNNELIRNSSETNVVEMDIENVNLWDVLKPYLYKAQIKLKNNDGKTEDVYTEEFGIRTIEVKDNKFLLNGKPVYFKGFGKHEDYNITGRGLNEALNVADINRMKWIGANSFRTSHYPYSEEMMRLADREGFLVIDETTAVGIYEGFAATLGSKQSNLNTYQVMKTTEAHEQVIRELIARDKNHACVVMWSIANEPASHQEGAVEYFEPLFNLARELDPQKRPCTFVNIMLAKAELCKVSHLSDVLCLNRYYGWYVNTSDLDTAYKEMKAELEKWHSLYPNKPLMFTEYGADTVAGFHDIDEMTPYTEEFQVEYYKMNEKIFDELPYFIGEQTWNFADFQTKFGLIRVQGNKKGVFTRDRMPKAVAHHLRERWLNIPNINYKK